MTPTTTGPAFKIGEKVNDPVKMYLEDILVTAEMRGQKIGSLLFDTLIKEAKEKKFTGMNWQVLEWNEPAINFYKKYNASFDPEWHNGSIVF